MKIVALADNHNMYYDFEVPECDVLIHAGDFSGAGFFLEFEDFLEWFNVQPARHKIFIAGNHDKALFFEPNRSKSLELLEQYPEITYLEDSFIMVDGFKIYGTPWTPKFYNWAFMQERGKPIKSKWDLIDYDTDILIVHGPPYDHGDKCVDEEKVGCKDLLERIQKIKPSLVICGHIHEAAGVYTINEKTQLMNVSIVDENYDIVRDPVKINFYEWI